MPDVERMTNPNKLVRIGKKQSTPGPIVETFEVLDPVFHDLVAAFCDGTEDEEVFERAIEAMRDVLFADQWYLCRCKGDPHTDSPILYARSTKKKAGTADRWTLVRGRGKHELDCPFIRTAKGKGVVSERVVRESSKYLGVLLGSKIKKNRGAKGAGQTVTVTPGASRVPTLARVLFTLFRDAGLQRTSQTARILTDDEEQLAKAIGAAYIAPGIRAEKYIAYGFSELENVSAHVIANASKWPAGHIAHGMIIERVELKPAPAPTNVLSPLKGKSQEIAGRVYRPGAGTKGVAIAIVLVTVDAKTGIPAMSRAYIHPAHDYKSLLLVDSDLERKTLQLLTQTLSGMEGDFSIAKPLFDDGMAGKPVRPDFVVERGIKKIVVETMGYQDAVYRQRKVGTHQVMKALPGVIDVVEHDANDGHVKSRVITLVS
jgi:hypothetical protein